MFCARLFSSTKLSGQTCCINSFLVSTWLLFSSNIEQRIEDFRRERNLTILFEENSLALINSKVVK